MKFGVREICDVVLKARAPMKVGNKVFYANEPVLYFDTLKTSSLEGASTTVYAQGGRGNARLVAWDGDRTLTFTMEDALISAEGFMILSGAGLVDATANNTIKQHVTEKTTAVVLAENKRAFKFILLTYLMNIFLRMASVMVNTTSMLCQLIMMNLSLNLIYLL